MDFSFKKLSILLALLFSFQLAVTACGDGNDDEDNEDAEVAGNDGDNNDAGNDEPDNDDGDDGDDGDCAAYCKTMADANCFALEAAIGFGDEASCVEACEGFNKDGAEGDLKGDTLQCREKHASLALEFKDTANGNVHCTHAGVDGGGLCVEDVPTAEEDFAKRYCDVALANCEEAQLAFEDNCEAEVTAALNDGTFRIDGNAADTEGKTIQCLLNTAVLAGAVDQTLCENALLTSTTCVD